MHHTGGQSPRSKVLHATVGGTGRHSSAHGSVVLGPSVGASDGPGNGDGLGVGLQLQMKNPLLYVLRMLNTSAAVPSSQVFGSAGEYRIGLTVDATKVPPRAVQRCVTIARSLVHSASRSAIARAQLQMDDPNAVTRTVDVVKPSLGLRQVVGSAAPVIRKALNERDASVGQYGSHEPEH